MQICSEIEDNLNNIYNNEGKNGDNNLMNKTQKINSSNNKYQLSKEQREIIEKINLIKFKLYLLKKYIYISSFHRLIN